MVKFKKSFKYVKKYSGHLNLKYVSSWFNFKMDFSQSKPHKKNYICKRAYIYKCLSCKNHVIIVPKNNNNGVTFFHWEDYFIPKSQKMLNCTERIIKDIIE